MSLKLFKISTTINHPNAMVDFKKDASEVSAFFKMNIGDEENIRRRKLDFVTQSGYTLKNIEKTDYLECTSGLLFSHRFIEKAGDLLKDEMQFFPCKVTCQGESLDWYAGQIKFLYPIIDKELSTYRTLTGGEKMIDTAVYRKDVTEHFYIARDFDYISHFVVSEIFVNLCKENDLLINFKEV